MARSHRKTGISAGTVVDSLNVDMSDLVDALTRETEDGLVTATELMGKTGCTRHAVKTILKTLFDANVLIVGRKKMTGMDGVERLVPAYKVAGGDRLEKQLKKGTKHGN